MRLFFEAFCIALKQALTDAQAGVSVGMIAHLALWTVDQGSAGGIAFHGLALVVANDLGMTAMAFSARIARVDPTGDDAVFIPGLVFAIAKDPPFHPVGAFRIAPAAILALLRSQGAQVLKDEDAGLMGLRELDNASADQVREVFVNVPDFGPEGGIVLFVFRQDTCLRAVACNAPKQLLPKSPLSLDLLR